MTEGKLEATGRTFLAPDGRLLEVLDGGAVRMALQLHREHRDKPALIEALERSEAWMRRPGVAGLAPLVDVKLSTGTLLYDTGPVWPVGRVLALCRESGGPSRARATLDLLASVAEALDQASRAAHPEGPGSHGSLGPWKLLLAPDGTPRLLGYGLPQLELLDEHGKLDVEAYRYAPPERLAGDPEDPTSDLWTLTLLGAELLLGAPLYDGDAERVRAAAERGVARDRLHRKRHDLETSIFEAFDQALRVHLDERPDPASYAAVCRDLARSPQVQGPTLQELLRWIAARDPDRPATPQASTEPPPSPERWQRVSRRRTEPSAGGGAPAGPDQNAMYPTDPLGREAVDVTVVVDGRSFAARVDPSESLAKSAARLVDALEVSTVDLTGRLRGWYRIVQGEAAWYGDAPTRVADLERPLELDWVANDILELTLEVDGRRERVPLGVAVHAGFLLAELARLLRLGAAELTLELEGRRLDPWQLLDDYAPEPGALLRIVEGGPGRRLRGPR